MALAGYSELVAHEGDRVLFLCTQSTIAPHISRLFIHESGGYFFHEITLHSQGYVLLRSHSRGAAAKAKAALGGIVSFSPGAHEVVASYVVT